MKRNCHIRRHAYKYSPDLRLTRSASNIDASTPNDTISAYTSRAGRIHTLKVCSLIFLVIPKFIWAHLGCQLTPPLAARKGENGLCVGMRECCRSRLMKAQLTQGI